MKILNWMQNKLSGRCGNKKQPNPISANIFTHARQEHCQEEFSDWPHGLLAIGTLGNGNDSKHTQLLENENLPSSQELLQKLTPEERGNLQNELDMILLKQVGIGSTCDNTDLGLEENRWTDESDHKNCHLQHSPDIVVGSRKDKRLVNKASGAINKNSLSFLLKKMFVCGTGFTPTPSLRDQVVPESKLEKNPSPALSTTKCLEDKQKTASAAKGDVNDKADDGSKWVKTDSEYIVLEI